MKKIGKNTKLYLIGMIIGGITLGITTVIADTIINSTSVAYKTTTVKAAIDELYGLADLKPKVETLEGYFKNSPGSYFDGNLLELGKNSSGSGIINFYKDGTITGQIFSQLSGRTGIVIGGLEGENVLGSLDLVGKDVIINEKNINELSKIVCANGTGVTDTYSQLWIWPPTGGTLLAAWGTGAYRLTRDNATRFRAGSMGEFPQKTEAKNATVPYTYCYAIPWQ